MNIISEDNDNTSHIFHCQNQILDQCLAWDCAAVIESPKWENFSKHLCWHFLHLGTDHQQLHCLHLLCFWKIEIFGYKWDAKKHQLLNVLFVKISTLDHSQMYILFSIYSMYLLVWSTASCSDNKTYCITSPIWNSHLLQYHIIFLPIPPWNIIFESH